MMPFLYAYLLDKPDLLADLRACFFLTFVEDHLVLLEDVAPVAVDGDDERAEFLHPARPERLRHPEIEPIRIDDLLDARGGDNCAARREYAVERLVVAAAAARHIGMDLAAAPR